MAEPPGISLQNLFESQEKPKYTNIFQELLYALLGFTGDVFVDDKENEDSNLPCHPPHESTFHITSDIDWIDGSDRALMDEILRMGFHYSQLRRFVASQQDLSSSLDSDICLRALAIGLDELCTVYHTAILRVQQHVMSDPNPVLSSIQHYLSEYVVILPAVHAILWELVSRPGADATAALDLLHDRSRCGIPALKSVLERLLWHCNQLLYQHLSAWMVHGLLLSNNFDFFIVRAPSAAPPPLPTHALPASIAFLSGAEEEVAWAAFDIQQARVPKYIPAMAPAKILFVGRAVRLLQRPRGQLANRQLLKDSQVMEWAKDLRQLQEDPTYSSIAFERTINRIHDQVSEALYALVVGQADLKRHLSALRDFLLLYRGDFFHAFLQEAQALLRVGPRHRTAQMDLIPPFQQAALKSGTDQHPFFHLVSIHWTPAPPKLHLGKGSSVALPQVDSAPAAASAAKGRGAGKADSSAKADGPPAAVHSWGSIQLRYELMWPLQLLLPPETMARYECLFVYLFSIQRATAALQDVWVFLMTRSKRQRGARVHMSAREVRVWALRQRMAHFMENLQVYLKVDVIEGGFSELEAALDASCNFSEVRRAHDAFLSRLVHCTFLTTAAIGEKLQTIMQACSALQRLVCDNGNDKLEDLTQKFNESSHALFMMLRSQKLQGVSAGGKYVRQLILRLDMNDQMDAAH